MIKACLSLTIGAVLAASIGCDKTQETSTPPAKDLGAASVANLEAIPARNLEHLGFANQAPGDVDFFISGHHADEAVHHLEKLLLTSGFFEKPADEDGNGQAEAEIPQATPYVGDEAFLWVGPGAGSKLEMIGTSYRNLSAAWAGFAVGTLLKSLGNQDIEPDLASVAGDLSVDLLDQWLNTLEKDSHIQLPSVVMGWKPAPEKHDECLSALLDLLGEMFVDQAAVTNVETSANGVELRGFELSAGIAFADGIAEAREAIANADSEDMIFKQLTPQRINRLVDALENMKFTVAAASKDGRVMLYLGNGVQGFQLAKTPGESLAASEALRWTAEFKDTKTLSLLYISEPMVRAALPWLDTSGYWNALSGAVGPPISEEILFRSLLDEMARTSRELAHRRPSPWSALLLADHGIRLESCGGWPDPALDYHTPLRMTGAAASQRPAIRAHWAQNRDRIDLEWKRIECLAHLIDATLHELRNTETTGMSLIPDGFLGRFLDEVRETHRAYREEFRAGIGDELAFIADMNGEVPPIPGISEETIKNATAPRFLIARPVKDREHLTKAGESFVQVWKNLSSLTTEELGATQAVILPQSIESSGLTTWYPPLPFIGGDFIPGVSLNDELWMLGSSQSMARDFSKAMASPSPGTETGMIVEIDFDAIRVWLKDVYLRNADQADGLTQAIPDEMRLLASDENLGKASETLDRIQKLTYRKWMADESPRTSFHLTTTSE